MAPVAEIPVLAAASGLNQMSNAAGSRLESLDSLSHLDLCPMTQDSMLPDLRKA